MVWFPDRDDERVGGTQRRNAVIGDDGGERERGGSALGFVRGPSDHTCVGVNRCASWGRKQLEGKGLSGNVAVGCDVGNREENINALIKQMN